jgi:hypothetical protein
VPQGTQFTKGDSLSIHDDSVVNSLYVKGLAQLKIAPAQTIH